LKPPLTVMKVLDPSKLRSVTSSTTPRGDMKPDYIEVKAHGVDGEFWDFFRCARCSRCYDRESEVASHDCIDGSINLVEVIERETRDAIELDKHIAEIKRHIMEEKKKKRGERKKLKKDK